MGSMSGRLANGSGHLQQLSRSMSSRLRRAGTSLLPLVWLTAAATAAWVIALQFGGHDDPFFAPIAAIVALSSPLGERGSNALKILAGVVIGISAGELTVLVLGGGYGRLALAVFAALAVARLLGGPRLVMVQAGASAILTVAASHGEAGVHRLIDASIGASVALVFSQIFLSPEPVALVRRAAADALGRIADALLLGARGLEEQDGSLVEDAVDDLRDLVGHLTELERVRKVSDRVARRSAIWRSQLEPTVQENENAGHVDLLGASSLHLLRVAGAADPRSCATLAPHIAQLGEAVRGMAGDLGDRSIRQDAADRALGVARNMARVDGAGDPSFTAVVLGVHTITTDVMIVAGVEPNEAAAVVSEGTGELRVPAPPGAPRLPFVSDRRPRRKPQG